MRPTPGNVFAIDCDDVNTIYDDPKGHSYFRSGETHGQPGSVFEHIMATIRSGRPDRMDTRNREYVVRAVKDP